MGIHITNVDISVLYIYIYICVDSIPDMSVCQSCISEINERWNFAQFSLCVLYCIVSAMSLLNRHK